MKILPKLSPLFLLPFALGLAQAAHAAPQADAAEPPAQYELQINGKPTPMTLGKEISLDRKAGRTRFMITRAATRRFEKSGVKFDYPADYNFEADLSGPGVAIWTLTGRNSLLMLQRFPLIGPAILREQMASELTKQYGKSNVNVGSTSIVLGGRKIEGKRLRVSLAKQGLVQEVFAFSNPKYSFVLMVQDSPNGSKETYEAKQLKALLSGSTSF